MPNTPSQTIKRLYKKAHPAGDTSLKDFAVDLASNGTKDERAVVEAWFKNKGQNKK